MVNEKVFDRVPRKTMQWTMRKNGFEEKIVRAVTSHYCGAKTKVTLKIFWCKLAYIKDVRCR